MDSIIANIVIAVAALTLLATTALTVNSVVHSLRVNKRPEIENGIPTRMISRCTVGLLISVALPTLIFGSLTDMCLITSMTMLVIATTLVTYGKIRTLKRSLRK